MFTMKLLRFIYNGLLTGMPMIAYNPFRGEPLHCPFEVKEKSLYINYILSHFQKNKLDEYLKNSPLSLMPITMNNETNYFLSLNIYNCSSPLFMNDNVMTRFEINTYVKNQYNETGTLILDYLCSELSMDPVNLFKTKDTLYYHNSSIFGINSKIKLAFDFVMNETDHLYVIDKHLIEFTDKVFYKNGIFDKIYYDTSLLNPILKIPYIEDLKFTFLNMEFLNPYSVFYFSQPIHFVGSMWHNLLVSDL